MNLEWREIEVFLTLAETLHFGSTADRLHISQARVSQTIRGLEIKVGGDLFRRTTRRVSITPIGEELFRGLEPAHAAVIASFAAARQRARDQAGIITVAFLGALAGRVVVELFGELSRRHPGLVGELQETPLTDPIQPLRDHQVDVAVAQFPVHEPGIVTGPVIIREPQVLGIARDHPLASRSSVSLEDLAGLRLFRPGGSPSPQWLSGYAPWFTPAGVPIPRGPEASTFPEMLAQIAAGEGVCPMGAHNARYHPRPDIAYVPFSDAPALEFGLAWSSGNETARLRAFIDTAIALIAGWGGPSAAALR